MTQPEEQQDQALVYLHEIPENGPHLPAVTVSHQSKNVGIHYRAPTTIISFDTSPDHLFLATQNVAILLSAYSAVLVAKYTFKSNIIQVRIAQDSTALYVLTDDGVLYRFQPNKTAYNNPSVRAIDLLQSGDLGRCIDLAITNRVDTYAPVVVLNRRLTDAHLEINPSDPNSFIIGFHATFDPALHISPINILLSCKNVDQISAYQLRYRITALCYGNLGLSFVGDITGRIYLLLSSDTLKERALRCILPASEFVPTTSEFSNFIFLTRAYPEHIKQIHLITPVILFLGYADGMMLTLNIKTKTTLKHDIACTNTYKAGKTKTRITGKPGIKARVLLDTDPLLGRFCLNKHKELQKRTHQYEQEPKQERESPISNDNTTPITPPDFLQEYIRLKDYLIRESGEGMMQELLDTFIEEWGQGNTKRLGEFFETPNSIRTSSTSQVLPKLSCILTKGFDSSQIALVDDYLVLFVGFKGYLVVFNLTAYDNAISKPIYLEYLLKSSFYKTSSLEKIIGAIELRIHKGRLLIRLNDMIHSVSLPQFLLPLIKYTPHFGNYRFYSRGEVDMLGNSEEDYPFDVRVIFAQSNDVQQSPFMREYKELQKKSPGWDSSIDLSVRTAINADTPDYFMNMHLYQETQPSSNHGIGVLTKSDPRSSVHLMKQLKESRMSHSNSSSIPRTSNLTASITRRMQIGSLASDDTAIADVYLRMAREFLIREKMLQQITKRFEYGNESLNNYQQFSPKQGIYSRYKQIENNEINRYDHTKFLPAMGLSSNATKGRHRRVHSLHLEDDYWRVIEDKTKRSSTKCKDDGSGSDENLAVSDLLTSSSAALSRRSSTLASVSGGSLRASYTYRTNDSVISISSDHDENAQESADSQLRPFTTSYDQPLHLVHLSHNQSMRPVVDLGEDSGADTNLHSLHHKIEELESPSSLLTPSRSNIISDAIKQAMLLSHEETDASDESQAPADHHQMPSSSSMQFDRLESKRIDNIVDFILSTGQRSDASTRSYELRSLSPINVKKEASPPKMLLDAEAKNNTTSWPRIHRVSELCSVSKLLSENKKYTTMASTMIHILKLPRRDTSSAKIQQLLNIHKDRQIFATLAATNLFTTDERIILKDILDDARFYYQQLGFPAVSANKIKPSIIEGVAQWQNHNKMHQFLSRKMHILKPDIYFKYPERNIRSTRSKQYLSSHAINVSPLLKAPKVTANDLLTPNPNKQLIKELTGLQVFSFGTLSSQQESQSIQRSWPNSNGNINVSTAPASSIYLTTSNSKTSKIYSSKSKDSSIPLKSTSSPVNKSFHQEQVDASLCPDPSVTKVPPSAYQENPQITSINPSAPRPMPSEMTIIDITETSSLVEPLASLPDISKLHISHGDALEIPIRLGQEDYSDSPPEMITRESRIFNSSPRLSDIYGSRLSKPVTLSTSDSQSLSSKLRLPSILCSKESSAREIEPCPLSASLGTTSKQSLSLLREYPRTARAASTSSIPNRLQRDRTKLDGSRETHHMWLRSKAQLKNTVRITVFSGIPKYYDMRTRIEYAHKHHLSTLPKKDLTDSMENVGNMVYKVSPSQTYPSSTLKKEQLYTLRPSLPCAPSNDERHGSNIFTDDTSCLLTTKPNIVDVIPKPRWSTPTNSSKQLRCASDASMLSAIDFLPLPPPSMTERNKGPTIVDLNEQLRYVLDNISDHIYGQMEENLRVRYTDSFSNHLAQQAGFKSNNYRQSQPNETSNYLTAIPISRAPTQQGILINGGLDPSSLGRISSALGNIVYKLTVMKQEAHRHLTSQEVVDATDEAWDNAVEDINALFPNMLRVSNDVTIAKTYSQEKIDGNLNLKDAFPTQHKPSSISPVKETSFKEPQRLTWRISKPNDFANDPPVQYRYLRREDPSIASLSPPVPQNLGLDGVNSAKYMRSLAQARKRYLPYSLKDVLQVFLYLDVSVGANGEIRSLRSDRLTKIYRKDPDLYGCADNEEDSDLEVISRVKSDNKRSSIDSHYGIAATKDANMSSYQFPSYKIMKELSSRQEFQRVSYLEKKVSQNAPVIRTQKQRFQSMYTSEEPPSGNIYNLQTTLKDYGIIPDKHIFKSQNSNVSIEIGSEELTQLLLKVADTPSQSEQLRILEPLLPEVVHTDRVFREELLSFIDEKRGLMEQHKLQLNDLIQAQPRFASIEEKSIGLQTHKREPAGFFYRNKVSLQGSTGKSISEQLKDSTHRLEITTLDVATMDTTKYTAQPDILLHSVVFSPKKFHSMRSRALAAKKKIQEKQSAEPPELIIPTTFFGKQAQKQTLMASDISVVQPKHSDITPPIAQNLPRVSTKVLKSTFTQPDYGVKSDNAKSAVRSTLPVAESQANTHNQDATNTHLNLRGSNQSKLQPQKMDILLPKVSPSKSKPWEMKNVLNNTTDIEIKSCDSPDYTDKTIAPAKPKIILSSQAADKVSPSSSLDKKRTRSTLSDIGGFSMTQFDSAPEVGLADNGTYYSRTEDAKISLNIKDSQKSSASLSLTAAPSSPSHSTSEISIDDMEKAQGSIIPTIPGISQDSIHSGLPPRSTPGTLRQSTLSPRPSQHSSVHDLVKTLPHPSVLNTISLRDKALLLAMSARSPYRFRDENTVASALGIHQPKQKPAPESKPASSKRNYTSVSPRASTSVISSTSTSHSSKNSTFCYSRSSSPGKYSESSDFCIGTSPIRASFNSEAKKHRRRPYRYGTLTPTEGFSTHPGRSRSCVDLFHLPEDDFVFAVQTCLVDYQSHDHTVVDPSLSIDFLLSRKSVAMKADETDDQTDSFKLSLTAKQALSFSRPLTPFEFVYRGILTMPHVPQSHKPSYLENRFVTDKYFNVNIPSIPQRHPDIYFRKYSSFKRDAELFKAQQLLVLAENLTSLSIYLHPLTQRALHAEYHGISTFGTYAETEIQATGLRKHVKLLYYNVPHGTLTRPGEFQQPQFPSATKMLPMLSEVGDVQFMHFLKYLTRRDSLSQDSLDISAKLLYPSIDSDQPRTASDIIYPMGRRNLVSYIHASKPEVSEVSSDFSTTAHKRLSTVLLIPMRSKSTRRVFIDRKFTLMSRPASRSSPCHSRSESHRISISPSQSYYSDPHFSSTTISGKSNINAHQSSFDSILERNITKEQRRFLFFNDLRKLERYSNEHINKGYFYDDCNIYYTLNQWKYTVNKHCCVHKCVGDMALISKRWEDCHGSAIPSVETRSVINRHIRSKIKRSKLSTSMLDVLGHNFQRFYPDTTYYSLGVCPIRCYSPFSFIVYGLANPLQPRIKIHRKSKDFLEASITDEEFVCSGVYEHKHTARLENAQLAVSASAALTSKTVYEIEKRFNKRLEILNSRKDQTYSSFFLDQNRCCEDLSLPSNTLSHEQLLSRDTDDPSLNILQPVGKKMLCHTLYDSLETLSAHNEYLFHLRCLTFSSTQITSAVFPQGLKFVSANQPTHPIESSFLTNLNAQYWGLIESWSQAYSGEIGTLTSATSAYVTIAEKEQRVMRFTPEIVHQSIEYLDTEHFLQYILKSRYDKFKYNRLRAQEEQLYAVCSDALPDLSKIGRKKRNKILNSYDIFGTKIIDRGAKLASLGKKYIMQSFENTESKGLSSSNPMSSLETPPDELCLATSIRSFEESTYKSLLGSMLRDSFLPQNQEIGGKSPGYGLNSTTTRIFTLDIQDLLRRPLNRMGRIYVDSSRKTMEKTRNRIYDHGLEYSAQELTNDIVYTRGTHSLASHISRPLTINDTRNAGRRPSSALSCDNLTNVKKKINAFARSRAFQRPKEFPIYFMELIILQASEHLACSLAHVFRSREPANLFKGFFEREFVPMINRQIILLNDIPPCTEASGFSHVVYGSEETLDSYLIINAKSNGKVSAIYDQAFMKQFTMLPVDSIDYRSFLLHTKAIDKHINAVAETLQTQKAVEKVELRNMQLKLLMESTREYSDQMAPSFDLWNRMAFNSHHILSVKAVMRYSEYFESSLKQFNGDLNALLERALTINHAYYSKRSDLFKKYKAVKYQKDLEYNIELERIRYLMREVVQNWRLHGPIYNISGLILIGYRKSKAFKEALQRYFPVPHDTFSKLDGLSIDKAPFEVPGSTCEEFRENPENLQTFERVTRALTLSHHSTRPTTATSCSSKSSKKLVPELTNEEELDAQYRTRHLFLSRLVLIELSTRIFQTQYECNMLDAIQYAVPDDVDSVFTKLAQVRCTPNNIFFKSSAREGLLNGKSRIGVYDYINGFSVEEMEVKQVEQSHLFLEKYKVINNATDDKVLQLQNAATTFVKQISRPNTASVTADMRLMQAADSTVTLPVSSPTKAVALALRINNLSLLMQNIKSRLEGVQKGELDNLDESIVEFTAQSDSFFSVCEEVEKETDDPESSPIQKDFGHANKKGHRVTISDDSHAPSAPLITSSSSYQQTATIQHLPAKTPPNITRLNVSLDVKHRSARLTIDSLRSRGMMTPRQDKDLGQILDKLTASNKCTKTNASITPNSQSSYKNSVASATLLQSKVESSSKRIKTQIKECRLPEDMSPLDDIHSNSTTGKRLSSQTSTLASIKSIGVHLPRHVEKTLMSQTAVELTPEYFSLNSSLQASDNLQVDNDELDNLFVKAVNSKSESNRRCYSSLERGVPVRRKQSNEKSGLVSNMGQKPSSIEGDRPIILTGIAVQKAHIPVGTIKKPIRPTSSIRDSISSSANYSICGTDLIPNIIQRPNTSIGNNSTSHEKVRIQSNKKVVNPWKKEPVVAQNAPLKSQYMSQSQIKNLITSAQSIEQGLADNLTETELAHIEALGQRRLRPENGSSWTTIGGIARPGSGIGTRAYSLSKRGHD